MRLGISIHAFGKQVPLSEQIRLMQENGIEYTFCMTEDEGVESIIQTVQNAGIRFEFLHAQLAHINHIWQHGDPAQKMEETLKGNIDLCSKYAIPYLVMHMSSGRPAPLMHDEGMERYDRLVEYARKSGVKIAFENSRAVANLAMALEKYEDMGFCWDLGHEYCFTPGMAYLPYFGNKLCCVHLHDNNCNLDEDLHLVPFDGRIDMDFAARRLAQANFDGCVMLELSTRKTKLYEAMTPAQYYAHAAKAAKRLAEKIEAYKTSV